MPSGLGNGSSAVSRLGSRKAAKQCPSSTAAEDGTLANSGVPTFDASDNFALRAATDYVAALGLRPRVTPSLGDTLFAVYGPWNANLTELDEHLFSLGAHVLTKEAPND